MRAVPWLLARRGRKRGSAGRFEGSLNTDLNEITMNLLPFPRLNFLLPALAPAVGFGDGASKHAGGLQQVRRIDQSFMETFQVLRQASSFARWCAA